MPARAIAVAPETERILKREFVSVYGQRDIREIKRHDIIELMDGAIERGASYQANRIHSNLRKLFNVVHGTRHHRNIARCGDQAANTRTTPRPGANRR